MTDSAAGYKGMVRIGSHPPCFSCTHLLGLCAAGSFGRCGNPGHEHVKARPEMGCGHHQVHERRAHLTTAADWIAIHGLPVAGFDDGIKPDRWRGSLTAREIRRMYDAEPTEAMQRLAWDIARLHDMLYRTHCALSLIVADMPHTRWRSTTQRLAELIGKEPAVAAAIKKAAAAKAKWR